MIYLIKRIVSLLPLPACQWRAMRFPLLRTRHIELRPLSKAGLLIAVLLLQIAGSAQNGDSPVKVRGGAMTFFSQKPWQTPLNTRGNTWCTDVSIPDATIVTVERVFENGVRQDRVVPLQSNQWKIEFYGHSQAETRQRLLASKDGIVMQASPAACVQATAGVASIRISPLSAASSFYGTDLPNSGLYMGNKRFAVPGCTKDRDRCERIAVIRIFDKDPSKPVFTYDCPDGECSVTVGKAARIAATSVGR